MKLEHYTLPYLPIEGIDMDRLSGLCAEAGRELVRASEVWESMPHAELLLEPLLLQEAAASSGIELVYATMEEVYSTAYDPAPTELQRLDVADILYHRQAMRYGWGVVTSRGFSFDLVKEMHFLLLSGPRGQKKTPGLVRLTQNWIRTSNETWGDDWYVPPSMEKLGSYIGSWMDYMETPDCDPLIKAGILHAYFEMIHPFTDGNGRLGRMIIPLYLYKSGVLDTPYFFLSDQLAARRDGYLHHLGGLHNDETHEAWTEWLEFFLKAVAAQAREGVRRAQAIARLYDELQGAFSGKAPALADAIFRKPAFTVPDLISAGVDMPEAGLTGLLDSALQSGLLTIKRPATASQPAVYLLAALPALAEGRFED